LEYIVLQRKYGILMFHDVARK